MVGRTSKRRKRGRIESFQSRQHKPHQQAEIEHEHEQPQQDRQQQEEEEEEEEQAEQEVEEELQQRQRQQKQYQLQHQHRHQQEQQQQSQIDDVVRNTRLQTSASDFALTPNGSDTTWTGHFQSDPAALGNISSVDALDDRHLDRQAANGTFSEVFPADFHFDLLNGGLDINQFIIPNLVDQNPAPFIFATSPVSGPASPNNYEINNPQVTAHMLSKGNMPQHGLYSEKCGQNRQFPHVVALTKIIVLLEAHIQSSTTAIDELMHVNKACMADLTRIMELKEFTLCKSCSILVSTAMELVITLYETAMSGHKAMSTVPDQQQRQLSSSSLPSCALSRGETIPNLQFGVFRLDHEDQMAIRNHIISKQLNRSVEIIRSLDSGGSNGGKVHKQWYVEMELRAKKLVSSMEESYC